MRTKALLLLAAVTAAGSLAVSAQSNVYSLNVVGYVNVTVPTNAHGFAIICNPLNNGGNTLNEILSGPPLGTKIYRFTPGFGYSIYTYDDFGFGAQWDDGGQVFNPGEGFWVKNPNNSSVTLTFTGNVPQQTLSNNIPAGFSLKGSMVPQSGQLDTVLGYPATLGLTRVYRYITPPGSYAISAYDDDGFGNGVWSTPPVPGVGEGFWISDAATNWVRTFTVPQ